jgi:uncharacterized OsmC-like protein
MPEQDEINVEINGVDLATVTDIAAEVDREEDRADELGDHTRSARVRWVDGFHSQAYSRGTEPNTYDEPEWLGGKDRAMAASEALLGAIGGCIATGFAANAAMREVEIHELEIAVEGEMDIPSFLGLGDGESGYEEIRVDIYVDCEAEGELLEEIAFRAVDLSPVTNTIRDAVDVDYDVEEL